MPKAFTDCVKNGGKVITKKIKGGKYIKICYDKEGNAHPGEVKKSEKSNQKSKKDNKKVVKDARATLEDLRKLKEHFDLNHSA